MQLATSRTRDADQELIEPYHTNYREGKGKIGKYSKSRAMFTSLI